jgi:hypothetical protein
MRRVAIFVMFAQMCVLVGSHDFPVYAVRSTPAQKFDPNGPAKKTVTVGSEFHRGWSAVLPALHTFDPSPVVMWRAAMAVIEQNQQQNTDTDAFLLGAHLRLWWSISDHPRNDFRLGQDSFAAFRRLQRKLGMSDAALFELTELSSEQIEQLKRDIDRWSNPVD